MYAKVIVDITHEKLDKIFEYHIPAELEERLHAGVEVVVPFGKGNREIKGYVIGLSEHCEYDPNNSESGGEKCGNRGQAGGTGGVDERVLWRDDDTVAKDSTSNQAGREQKDQALCPIVVR